MITFTVKVLLIDPVSLPDTARCFVEIRDVSLLDAPSISIRAHRAPVKEVSNNVLLTVQFELNREYLENRDLNVWAHLSLLGSEKVNIGDYITAQSYPLRYFDPQEDIEIVVESVG